MSSRSSSSPALFLGFLLASAIPAFSQSGVRLNEAFANNVTVQDQDGEVTDWVELYNTTSNPVDLGGASLTDDPSVPRKWVIPNGITMPGGGYLVIQMDSRKSATTTSAGRQNTGFGLGASGDSIYFIGRGSPGPLIDSVTFGLQAGDFTLGRMGGTWALCIPTPGAANSVAQLGDPSALRVNEWMAAPSSGDDWFEIYNGSSLPVSLGGLYLSDTDTDKTNTQIPPFSYIGTGNNAFVQIKADGEPEKGADHANFSLKAGGEAIGIFTSTGATIDYVTFGQQNSDQSQGRLPDGTANIVMFEKGTETPEGPNLLFLKTLWVNEVLSHTDPPWEDAVEFYNPTDADGDISGWWLSNSKSNLKKYRLPANTVVPAKGYKVIYEGAFNNSTLAAQPFTFNSAHGDQVYLAEANANGDLTGKVVGEEFESAENAVSFGRYQTSVPGDYKFVAMVNPTFGVSNPASPENFRTGNGAANSAPRVGPVVVNEIMYNPGTNNGADSVLDEYVELYNTTASQVKLFDPNAPTNQWRLRDAVSFTFPPNTTLPAFGYALVVPFDPVADATTANAFRAKFNVPQQTPLFGPFSGKLDNAGDAVEFYKPDQPQGPQRPDAGYVPWIRVDKINYLSGSPWPTGADGSGKSLQRKNPTAFGNDPINWEAANPTAGRSNSPELADDDGDGMPNEWETLHNFDINNPADASQDADGDGLTNLQEYIAGTDPRQSASGVSITAVTLTGSGTNQTAQISFPTVAGRSYSVLYRNSLLPSTTWQQLERVDATGSTSSVTDPEAGERQQRFYLLTTPAVD